MSTLLDDIRNEIVDAHDFFVQWFTGTIARDQLEPCLLARFDRDVTFISPEGQVYRYDALKEMFENGYGSNTDFRIEIRDVFVRHGSGDMVLATYTEWQAGAFASNLPNNARVTSAVLQPGPPFKWLHIHETWLPDKIREAGPFDF
ncbi:hypothetical protein [uncultured Roseibium sp.]|uniref:hypothetical protein n=1 Tax=uncultured Roseibium sp. TaxID=1936171 RepID=UPI00260994AC|nr:hypothetical protein [uncultured Roseibium sp.]